MTALSAPALTTDHGTVGARATAVLARAGHVAVAGAVAGLIALGGGSRLAMRLVALSSGRIGSGIRPESGAVPGEFTAEGTVFLLAAGTFIGIVLAVLVGVVVDRWLPRDGRRRAAMVTVLCAAIPWMVLVDPGNHDFSQFGPRWFAVALFLAVATGYGLLVAALASPGRMAHPRAIWAVPGALGVGLAAAAMGAAGPAGLLVGAPVVLFLVVMRVVPDDRAPRWWCSPGLQHAGEWLLVAVAVLAVTTAAVRAGQIVLS